MRKNTMAELEQSKAGFDKDFAVYQMCKWLQRLRICEGMNNLATLIAVGWAEWVCWSRYGLMISGLLAFAFFGSFAVFSRAIGSLGTLALAVILNVFYFHTMGIGVIAVPIVFGLFWGIAVLNTGMWVKRLASLPTENASVCSQELYETNTGEYEIEPD